MSADGNAAALRQAIEHWNRGDLEGYLRLYDPACVVRYRERMAHGVDEVRHGYAQLLASFPGCQLVLHDVLAEGETVALRFTLHAMHQGKPRQVPGLTFLRFVEGRCVERWSYTAPWEDVSDAVR